VKKRATWSSVCLLGTLAVSAMAAVGCGNKGGAAGGGVSPQKMTDALFAVISADRAVYTREVVNRLTNDKVIQASERYQDEKTLPLPAMMLRMGAEHAKKTDSSFSYALLSLQAINKQNAPKTEVEKEGLQFVNDNAGKNFYKEETLGDKKYFTAVYADKAVVEACVNCHNGHKDSPKKDFKVGDTMGAVVIRVPL
jgi:hypothetical protein